MTRADTVGSEATRLETLWGGEFGDQYVDRNSDSYAHRAPFWSEIVELTGCVDVLEVGCNVGGNLGWLADLIPPHHIHGVDINRKALAELSRRLPGVNRAWAPARELPYRDRWFDLVFTMGVLIHQPTTTLPLVMSEMVRTSRRWVLCGEYQAETTEEVEYRGHAGALFRRDYGSLFLEHFPELRVQASGFLSRAEGWDDVTWWLLERT